MSASASNIPGLELACDFLSADEEADLIASINAEELEPFQFQGWVAKRLTATFGWGYDFTTGRLGPASVFPDWLSPILDRAAAFAQLAPDVIEQALLTRYDAGAGIGWHRDRPEFGHVIGISLGHPATMRLRRRRLDGFDRATIHLAPRSIYHLSGDVRTHWEHSIAPIEGPRWSITLRSLNSSRRRRASDASKRGSSKCR